VTSSASPGKFLLNSCLSCIQEIFKYFRTFFFPGRYGGKWIEEVGGIGKKTLDFFLRGEDKINLGIGQK
jgi:hypothetical protein